ncbi:macrophage infectivity potentiator-related protein [Klebsiella pneumoniae]|uniref:Macrophage infectivity potentiator-related protein n=1 Tax=Klebsiella pneumoniae TaxID=573 RepID=A0A378FSH8_KLEPN|nr:macrophage infectivity potentiator-related protein [Klebsiella pneumoniae]
MSRLADIREQDATGKAADIFAGIKKRWAKCRTPT